MTPLPSLRAAAARWTRLTKGESWEAVYGTRDDIGPGSDERMLADFASSLLDQTAVTLEDINNATRPKGKLDLHGFVHPGGWWVHLPACHETKTLGQLRALLLACGEEGT